MSADHSIICDQCRERTEAEFDGINWLPPQGWAILTDPDFVPMGQHLCRNCVADIGTTRMTTDKG